ncbi:hypothetical protein U9337_11245 [Escherichia coli]
MKSLFNRLTGKAVSRTAFVEHLGQEVIQHHPNWKVMISTDHKLGNDSNLLIVFYVQIMPDDFVMQLHRF